MQSQPSTIVYMDFTIFPLAAEVKRKQRKFGGAILNMKEA